MKDLERKVDKEKEPTKGEILQEKIYSLANKVVWNANGAALTMIGAMGLWAYLCNFDKIPKFYNAIIDKTGLPEKGILSGLAVLSIPGFFVLKKVAYGIFKHINKGGGYNPESVEREKKSYSGITKEDSGLQNK